MAIATALAKRGSKRSDKDEKELLRDGLSEKLLEARQSPVEQVSVFLTAPQMWMLNLVFRLAPNHSPKHKAAAEAARKARSNDDVVEEWEWGMSELHSQIAFPAMRVIGAIEEPWLSLAQNDSGLFELEDIDALLEAIFQLADLEYADFN